MDKPSMCDLLTSETTGASRRVSRISACLVFSYYYESVISHNSEYLIAFWETEQFV